MNAVEVRNLNKHFNAHHAVVDVSFDVPVGGSLGIAGESGAGKTTIARMLVGLERPSSGTITVLGRDRSQPARSAKERNARARELQIVFQDPYTSLDPSQSAQAAVKEVLRHHGHDPDVTEQIINQVGLTAHQAAVRPRELSGGQRQRVAIAKALAASPEVLILDEAVSALDVSVQAQVLNLLADIRDNTGITYILISHDLAVIRQLCDQLLVLRHGRAVESGPCGQVLDAPKEQYTRTLREAATHPGPRTTA